MWWFLWWVLSMRCAICLSNAVQGISSFRSQVKGDLLSSQILTKITSTHWWLALWPGTRQTSGPLFPTHKMRTIVTYLVMKFKWINMEKGLRTTWCYMTNSSRSTSELGGWERDITVLKPTDSWTRLTGFQSWLSHSLTVSNLKQIT